MASCRTVAFRKNIVDRSVNKIFPESYSSVAKFDQELACFVVDNGQSDRGRGVTVLVSAGGGSCEIKLCQSCGSPGRTARGNSQEGARGKSCSKCNYMLSTGIIS